MKKNTLPYAALALSVLVLFACKREQKQEQVALVAETPVLPEEAYNYNEAPENPFLFPGFVDNHKATLGRVLFYDKKLSVNNAVSCGTCHRQTNAFSDVRNFSFGFTGKPTARNSMPIFNLQATGGFFWDVRENDLQTMVLRPVENHIEMGFDNAAHIVEKIKHTPYYEPLFQKAFGINSTEEIEEGQVRAALAEFVRSLVSGSSKYDQGRNSNYSNFTAQELQGLKLFSSLSCNGCHIGETFSPNSSWSMPVANIGLDKVYKDKGASATGKGFPVEAEGFFKIPSLRNIALTAPYMHDGRFTTLEEVVEHYNSGIQNHKYLDWHFRSFEEVEENGQIVQRETVRRFNLSPQDKAALVAFLKTLTDTRLTTETRYSNPFRSVK